MHSIVVSAQGGPEVLEYAERPDPVPGEGEVVVDVAAAGVNFIDIYHRSGAYPLDLPTSIGMEGAGTVSAVGPGVRDLAVGETVAWADVMGSYSGKVVVPAARAVPVPDGVPADIAAAAMLQGMTAHYLTHSTNEVREGDQVLVHAGAGGMGQLLIRLAKLKGAKVYTTVSTDEKGELARQAGADEVLRYDEFTDALRGKIDVVYDGVGRTTFDGGLEVLRPRGLMALYGAASGPVPPLDPQTLNRKGSLFLTRPTLAHHIAQREELLQRASDLFGWISAGQLPIDVSRRYPLAEARRAHEDLAARRTTGKLLLLP
ncbi:quinone oxidoreductase [Nonomuraea sp. KC401]|uniref:quinone oxidoreductase family protein n=1 Tax=unclassified Nonomuraea TaxID=2593643 RepID=UPI0010FED580|nr:MULTISPECIES: quinone oxidoreductase [unclassified Nonomuraea]NBF00519.1 zinc-binding dehydrogenase [Nonomuraea sp. K271]TLF73766.1 quinone oxidoreductase [Nonomuraea sp. KC401]